MPQFLVSGNDSLIIFIRDLDLDMSLDPVMYMRKHKQTWCNSASTGSSATPSAFLPICYGVQKLAEEDVVQAEIQSIVFGAAWVHWAFWDRIGRNGLFLHSQ